MNILLSLFIYVSENNQFSNVDNIKIASHSECYVLVHCIYSYKNKYVNAIHSKPKAIVH